MSRTGPECPFLVTLWEVSWLRVELWACTDATGHGALMLYLKNPGMYKSASAFAPAW